VSIKYACAENQYRTCDPACMCSGTAQVAARVFVHGTGDCGQLGLGEDEMERKRPTPVDLSGRRVRHRRLLLCACH
jgi:hypothetical protein